MYFYNTFLEKRGANIDELIKSIDDRLGAPPSTTTTSPGQ